METLPIIIAIVGVIATIFAYVFGSHSADTKVLALKEKLDDSNASSKPKASVSKKASKKKKAQNPKKPVKTEDSKKLSELKDTLKKTKGQLHSAKDEIKSLKDEAKKHEKTSKNTNAKKNSDLIFSLREEVGELKSALENAKLKSSKTKEKAPQVDKVIETEGLDDASKKIVDELEAQHREKLKKANDKHRKLEKEIKSKLRKASSNVDKQRRRADNNDRAYKITQRQVDVLQERIAFLEKAGGSEVQIAAPQLASAVQAAPKTVKLPATKAPEPKKVEEEIDDAVPGGLEAPSEPTTIEMSPDLAEELFKPSAIADKSDVASPSSIVEEKTRETVRLDEIKTTNQLEIPEVNKSLAEPSAVDEAWAEFDVD